jgi:hypothetical protein
MRIPADHSLPDRVRTACAWVAGRARSVTIDPDALAAYADRLSLPPQPPDPEPALLEGGREGRAAFVICLDAINFGSGWWPTIRKRAGHSGYATMATALGERFREGAWSAVELRALTPAAVATVLGQEATHPLMADYASALRDVGAHVAAEYGDSFERLVDSAAGSAPALAELLAGWQAFADVSTYEDRPVPFFKRAQIAAADLDRMGAAALGEQERLTAFADNLVPHVLRDEVCSASTPGSRRGSKRVSCSSTARPRRSSCAPAPSTRSSCSPPPRHSAPPRSTPPSGTVAANPATSPSRAPVPATPPTECRNAFSS